jgi:uncharacterized protein
VQWLNEPAQWCERAGALVVTTDAGTDFWRITEYGYIRDNGHLYGDYIEGDFELSMRIRGSYAVQYDQAGAMVRVSDRRWLKTGIEFVDGRPRFSTVITLEHSSWAVADLPGELGELGLLVTRRGDAVEVRYRLDGGDIRLAALAYMPPDQEVLAGAMCAAPEGGGFEVAFNDLTIAGRVKFR